MDLLVPILLIVGVVAFLAYAIYLQKRAMSRQNDAIQMGESSVEKQERGLKQVEETLMLTRETVDNQRRIMRCCRKHVTSESHSRAIF